MTAKEFIDKGYWGLPVEAITLYACRYLEKRGQRFLVDFGYENAKAKAVALMCKELDGASIQ